MSAAFVYRGWCDGLTVDFDAIDDVGSAIETLVPHMFEDHCAREPNAKGKRTRGCSLSNIFQLYDLRLGD